MFAIKLLAILALFAFSAHAGTEQMVQFAKQYCDKTVYDVNGNIIGRGEGFGGDCAHFVSRSLSAGGCLPLPPTDASMWDYADIVDGGSTYKVICVGGPNKCWGGPNFNINIGGLHEFLRDHGWINTLQHPTHWEAVGKACAVIGNPIGPNRGDWDHAAFGIGAPRRIAAHTSDHCDVDVTEVFERLNAVWCPPPVCQNCPPCGACENCQGMVCVDASTAKCPDRCTFCSGGQCAFTDAAKACNANKCTACVGGACTVTAAARSCAANKCTECRTSDGACVPTAAAASCASNKCTECKDGACVPTAAAASCASNKCTECKDGACVPTAAATACAADKCMMCKDGQCVTSDFAKTCAANKCMECKDGKCVPTAAATECASNLCNECNPSDGTCGPKANATCENRCTKCNPASGQCDLPTEVVATCTACEQCNPGSGQCKAITNKCGVCETCDPETGGCSPVQCDTCNSCDSTTGICAPTPDADCAVLNGTACQAAKCDATGTCSLRTITEAIGTAPCGPATSCAAQLCGADGQCEVVNLPVGSPCSDILIDQCTTSQCDGEGKCVAVPIPEQKICQPDRAVTDRNVSLCQQFKCINMQCVAVPRAAGTNCTHRRNESDLAENICVFSLCDERGMCVHNATNPACTSKKRKATAAIIGGAVGGAVALLAAVGIGIFVAAKGAAPISQGLGFDSAAGATLNNPAYVQMADTNNLLYEGKA